MDNLNTKVEGEIRYLIARNGNDLEWVRANFGDIVRWYLQSAEVKNA